MKHTYHYILMTQKSLFASQVIEEILREKTNYYKTSKKKKDFWILTSPKFIFEKDISENIKGSRFYKTNKENIKYLSAIVSTDKSWIRWLELRIGYFEDNQRLQKDLDKLAQKLEYTSDGIIGSFELNNNLMLLENNLRIDPNIIAKEYEYIDSVLDKY